MRWGAYRGKRDNKYGNTPQRCMEGIVHHSKKEAKRCNELHALLRGGLIRELEAHPQPRYDLAVNGVPVCSYMPDFRYVDCDSGDTVVEDTKGVRTREYELKKRLMLACNGIEVVET